MRKGVLTAALAVALALFAPVVAGADSRDEQISELLRTVQALQQRVEQLEGRLGQTQQNLEETRSRAAEAAAQAEKAHESSMKVSRELMERPAAEPKDHSFLGDAGSKIKIYGGVEVEAGWQRRKDHEGAETTESNISLATAEVFLEAQVNPYVSGLIHFLYEDGDDGVGLDEGFILLGQTDDVPFYLMGGRYYPAVALFESYMISDPITLNVFETQAQAVEIGYVVDFLGVALGTYNGDTAEASDDDDDLINTFYARLDLFTPEDLLGGVRVHVGGAYTNNIATNNWLGEQVDSLQDLVGGWSVMGSVEYGMLAITGEYIAAGDDFDAGELTYKEGALTPKAWNVELAVMPLENWTVALRYEGSSDLGGEEPETQWGMAVAWDFLEGTTWSVEYLHGDYEDEGERDAVTTQLAVGF